MQTSTPDPYMSTLHTCATCGGEEFNINILPAKPWRPAMMLMFCADIDCDARNDSEAVSIR